MRTICQLHTVGFMMGNTTLVSLLGFGVLRAQILSTQLRYPGLNIPQCVNISLIFQVRRSLFAAVSNRSTLVHEVL